MKQLITNLKIKIQISTVVSKCNGYCKECKEKIKCNDLMANDNNLHKAAGE